MVQTRLARPYPGGLFKKAARSQLAAGCKRWTQRPQQATLLHLAPMGSRVTGCLHATSLHDEKSARGLFELYMYNSVMLA